MKRWIALLLMVLLIFGAYGCRGKEKLPDLSQVQDTNVLRVGGLQSPPFCAYDASGWQGFDVELALEIGRRLGVTVEFCEIQDGDRWNGLQNGEIDCIIGGVSATDFLVDTVDLSQTYLVSRPVLLVAPELSRVMDFTDISIAVEQDSACALAAQACLGPVKLVNVANQQEAVEQLLDGQVDGAIVDEIVGMGLIQQLSGGSEDKALVYREDLELGVHELTIALRLNSDLTDRINQILTELQEEGFLDNLAQRYGIQDRLVVG